MTADTPSDPPAPGRPPSPKGRGALGNPPCRFAATHREALDDGWRPEERAPLRTTVSLETTRSIISRNTSPDLPFEQSVNPYRGCEHGCIYCYARPTHAWLGLSPGLDFESRLHAKPDAAARLRETLGRPGYRVAPIALGANTDPYQPIERTMRLTRAILEVLRDFRHPVGLTTKGSLIERDLDILAGMARERLLQVQISITTLDRELARRLEPRAATPARRLETVRRLSAAGIPVTVLVAPVIPALTDAELERVLAAGAEAGASAAGYSLLRLPLELHALFDEWLVAHAPQRRTQVLNLIRASHGGRIYRAEFGSRQRGSGAYADMIGQRFRLAMRRLGLQPATLDLDSSRFRVPASGPVQLSLF